MARRANAGDHVMSRLTRAAKVPTVHPNLLAKSGDERDANATNLRINRQFKKVHREVLSGLTKLVFVNDDLLRPSRRRERIRGLESKPTMPSSHAIGPKLRGSSRGTSSLTQIITTRRDRSAVKKSNRNVNSNRSNAGNPDIDS